MPLYRTVSDRGLWKKYQRDKVQHFHKPQYLEQTKNEPQVRNWINAQGVPSARGLGWIDLDFECSTQISAQEVHSWFVSSRATIWFWPRLGQNHMFVLLLTHQLWPTLLGQNHMVALLLTHQLCTSCADICSWRAIHPSTSIPRRRPHHPFIPRFRFAPSLNKRWANSDS